MPLKDIVIGFSNGKSSNAVVNFGLNLARQFAAEVTATHVHVPVEGQNQIITWMPEHLMDQLEAANREGVLKAKKKFDNTVIETGYEGAVGWNLEEGDINDTLATVARYYDLLIIGKYAESLAERGLRIRAENIVTRSGRPVIVVPPKYKSFEKTTASITVAWDGSYPAARALFDAIHLFGDKAKFDIVSVINDHATQTPAKDISRYIETHGIEVEMHVIKSARAKASEEIAEFCYRNSAGMLVLGVRDQARLREGIFGGGTGHALLENAQIPLFISH